MQQLELLLLPLNVRFTGMELAKVSVAAGGSLAKAKLLKPSPFGVVCPAAVCELSDSRRGVAFAMLVCVCVKHASCNAQVMLPASGVKQLADSL